MCLPDSCPGQIAIRRSGRFDTPTLGTSLRVRPPRPNTEGGECVGVIWDVYARLPELRRVIVGYFRIAGNFRSE